MYLMTTTTIHTDMNMSEHCCLINYTQPLIIIFILFFITHIIASQYHSISVWKKLKRVTDISNIINIIHGYISLFSSTSWNWRVGCLDYSRYFRLILKLDRIGLLKDTSQLSSPDFGG